MSASANYGKNAIIDPRSMSPAQRSSFLDQSFSTGLRLSTSIPHGAAIHARYHELLKFVVESDYLGACHDTSAVLHMLLSESGVDSTLCIGEVGAGSKFFDHSWVEVAGQVFDVAVCMPNFGIHAVGGPVFGSTDITTGAPTELLYGVQSGQGLGAEAIPALQLDLGDYAAIQPQPNLWVLAVLIDSRCGNLDATFKGFHDRYGHVRRVERL